MKLSVSIVNYSVCDELERCLLSVQQAMQGIDGEVFVVDNASTDNSCAMVSDKFPWVKLIANKENVGFAAANNQAIRQATGEYILLLNPDTTVCPDTFSTCVSFMDEHPDCGGLGVKMYDANGNFLPESKRGVPTPFVAFCKMSGLYKLFPKSNTFNHYYLGGLSENEMSEIEILAGAYMFLRKSILDEIGLLDERYFLYGEDIDISYRILLQGYKNYYLPTTRITHVKGVSTQKNKKASITAFYNAMEIFVDTHLNLNYGNSKCVCRFKTFCSRMYVWFVKKSIHFCLFLALINNKKDE
ncbi:MAG: glycosyltransferase family 2 protein [Bacteroidales bacterium]|nr:glycosyltransferase family 2 protein [Bacteroidales bacterium]